MAARDRFIGWDDAARQAHLQRVVCNSRFLIRPHLRVPDLASHVLARCLRRLPDDWQAHHGGSPVLVETFIDRSRHRGGCYRAANWRYVGDTRGRGRNDVDHTAERAVKAIYVYPLARQWRRALGAEHGSAPAPAVDDWACHEFAHALLWDRRLHQRVITVSRDFAAQSTAPLPQACGTRAKTKAAYRLFDHPNVTMQALLRSHYQATAARCRGQPVVLAVQDTTSLNYTRHQAMAGIGPISTRQHQARGLVVHDTLALTPDGTPLGMLDGQCWAREQDPAPVHRAKRALTDKESRKWQASHAVATQLQQQCNGTRVVSVADREGDIYELLLDASDPAQADVLVRAHHLRRFEISGPQRHKLIDKLKTCPVAGRRDLAIPPRGSVAARTAHMAVRYAPVKLKPPKDKPHLPPVTLYAVHTTEINPPAGVQPLAWTLLTSVPTDTFDAACERLSWYASRWQIEVYHRTLKSGCRIEDRQLADSSRLENCLAIDMVVAWRVFLLAKQGREQPDQPCSAYFEPDEWKALLVRTGAHHEPSPADDPRSTMPCVWWPVWAAFWGVAVMVSPALRLCGVAYSGWMKVWQCTGS